MIEYPIETTCCSLKIPFPFSSGLLTEQIHRTQFSPHNKDNQDPPSLPRKGVQASTTRGRTQTRPIQTKHRKYQPENAYDSFSHVCDRIGGPESTRPGQEGPIQYLVRGIFIAASRGPGIIRVI